MNGLVLRIGCQTRKRSFCVSSHLDISTLGSVVAVNGSSSSRACIATTMALPTGNPSRSLPMLEEILWIAGIILVGAALFALLDWISETPPQWVVTVRRWLHK